MAMPDEDWLVSQRLLKKWKRKFSTMAAEEEDECVGNVKRQLSKVFKISLKATVPQEPHFTPLIVPCHATFADYACNNAMGLFSKIIKGENTVKRQNAEYENPTSVGEAILKNLTESEMIESCSIAGPGFVNTVLSRTWLAKRLQKMLTEGIHTWAPKLPVRIAVVEFSSPRIAREMHVGNLRSTIIGDTLARMLEFSGVHVLRRNYVGDWGIKFDMLIEFLLEQFPQLEEENEISIHDLKAFYKESKKKFDEDKDFKERAKKAVVNHQFGEDKYCKAWAQICEISRKEFQKVYKRLGVQLEEQGKRFYNPDVGNILTFLCSKDIIKECDGAHVIFLEGKERPLILVKSDGGFKYASNAPYDLAALWHHIIVEDAEWTIYVTDVGQREHFEMLFNVARSVGWLPSDDNEYPKVDHVGFGLVLGEDGKCFRSRSSEVVSLVDLLDEAKSRSKQALIEKGKDKEWSEEQLEQTAQAFGYGAVKYADLKNYRLTNYTFNFDQMLNDKGNTAVYLLNAHARICSIISKSGKDIEELKKSGEIALDHSDERALGLYLLHFSEVVEEACKNLLPNLICEYLYNLSDYFTKFHSNCQVVGSPEETSRLLLCEATAVVMRKCFDLLGIEPVYQI